MTVVSQTVPRAADRKHLFDLSLTVLGSGSSGNCSLISAGETHILVDAGFSCKEIVRRMALRGFSPDMLTAVLITHEHSDHIQSVHTISNRYDVPIFCTEGTFANAIQGKRFFDWIEIQPGRAFDVGDLTVHPITLPHDAEDPVGFRLEHASRTIAHMTDFGYVSGLVRESLTDCDLVLVEANHDLEMLKQGPYPWMLKQRIASRLGHLSNDALFETLPAILHDDLSHLVLGHMSETNNDPRLLTLQIRRILKRVGLPDLPFVIAPQNEPLDTLST